MFNNVCDQVIAGAGHHLYADKPKMFNQIVNEACNLTDKGIKLPFAQSTIISNKASVSEEVTKDSDDKPQPITN